MTHFYRLMGTLLIVGSIWLLPLDPAFAQFTLVSSTPADGAVNVASPATFQFTFSSALDTTARFEEPDDFFLAIEIFPEDSAETDPDISLSSDMRTVTVSGVELPADTRFTVLLTGARSQGGEALDRPYVMNFTTGSSLPSGTVSGTVSFQGNPANGALVALFEELFEDDLMHVGVVTSSSFTINYVPDGTYYPISVMDTNGNGEVDPSDGDAMGFYDQNADGVPDSVVVSGGNALSGISIDLVEPVLQTARSRFTDVESEAQSWAADAELVGIRSEEISTGGQSYGWSYVYFSPSLNEYNEFFIFADLVISEGFDDDHEPDVTPLPETWVDSDAAMLVADTNGGSDFRAAYGDAEVDASLEYFHLYYEDDSSSGTAQLNKSFLAKRSANRRKLDFSSKTIGDLAVWNFYYWSDDAEKWHHIEINAETGALLASEASTNLDAAKQSAQSWASDAVLVKIGSEREVTPNGLSTAWGFIYHSVALDSVLKFIVVSGAVLDTGAVDYGVPSLDALPENFCSSTDAVAIAQQASENFRAQYPDAYINAELSRGISEDPEKAVWRIGYYTNEQNFEIFIESTTCALLTGIENKPGIVEKFTLQQNYPNPFNPTTEITYHLPATTQVELTIFNLLGQKIRTIVNEIQAAGSYRLSWNATDENGKQVPSGVYIYLLKSGEFKQSRKMLLVR
ncbi:T9SS type A sorting domain-containing protein [candidate division KSB1 bacterium]|nr:T9SS type A sorting domain-containing protein [candidate division KSB1 bacterium]